MKIRSFSVAALAAMAVALFVASCGAESSPSENGQVTSSDGTTPGTEPGTQAKTAWLSVAVNPAEPGTTVQIAGPLTSTTKVPVWTRNESAFAEELALGTYDVTASCDGYQAVTKTVTLDVPGTDTPLVFTLEPVEGPIPGEPFDIGVYTMEDYEWVPETDEKFKNGDGIAFGAYYAPTGEEPGKFEFTIDEPSTGVDDPIVDFRCRETGTPGKLNCDEAWQDGFYYVCQSPGTVDLSQNTFEIYSTCDSHDKPGDPPHQNATTHGFVRLTRQ